MINKVLKEFNERFNKSFDDSFYGQLCRLESVVQEPNYMLSNTLISRIKELKKHFLMPLQVGVIGQFSSGKSTLLNLLFDSPLLATGARPVSVVATYINYGEKDVVLGTYESGVRVLSSSNLNDQNEDTQGLKKIDIFCKNELLKDIALIDTPGLNANETDEEFSSKLIASFDAVIYLTLALSAGKASEQKSIDELLFGVEKVCLVNQKDKLSPAEQEHLLEYLNTVFAKNFSKIALISCKMAAENQADSGIENFYEFLQGLDKNKIKTQKITQELAKISDEIEQIVAKNSNSLSELGKIIEEFLSDLENKKIEFDALNDEILNALKEIAACIAKEFMNNFKSKKAKNYTAKNALLHKNCFAENEYEFLSINPDETFLNIFYNSDKLNKEFLKIRRKINALFSDFKGIFEEKSKEFKTRLNILKTKQLNSQKSPLVSDEFYALSLDFFKAIEELIINDFDKKYQLFLANLDAFFEKINIKALSNYENATKLSLSFFYEKINASREFYELDCSQFKLYTPSENEIKNRLLSDCAFYEFEDLLVNKRQIKKYFSAYLEDLRSVAEQKIHSINRRKNTLSSLGESITKCLNLS